MIISDFNSVLLKYKDFRDENYEVISKANQLKKEIRFLKQFGDYTNNQIIELLYQSEDDVPDIAEILGISEYEVFYWMNETRGSE